MRNKRIKLKLLKLLGITRCSTINRRNKRYLLKSDPNYIYNNRSVSSHYPENWKNRVSIVTSTGEIIDYNPVENQKATDAALEKLKRDVIKGNTLEE